MRRLDRSAGTRRPAGHGVSTQVQRDDDRLPSDAVEADIGRIGQSVLNGTINGGAAYTGENAAFQFVTQNRGPGPVDRQCGRAPQGRSAGDVFRAGPAIALMMSAEGDRLERNPLAGVKCADTLGRAEFMSADGVKVHAEFSNVHGSSPRHLNSIGVK